MRLLKTTNVSLERKPSWVDSGSVFDSFYKMKSSNSGSMYRSNSRNRIEPFENTP
jgi:hypothetical protein